MFVAIINLHFLIHYVFKVFDAESVYILEFLLFLAKQILDLFVIVIRS